MTLGDSEGMAPTGSVEDVDFGVILGGAFLGIVLVVGGLEEILDVLLDVDTGLDSNMLRVAATDPTGAF